MGMVTRRSWSRCGRRRLLMTSIRPLSSASTTLREPISLKLLTGRSNLIVAVYVLSPPVAAYADLPGAGAAGGLGAAFASLGAELLPGASTILDLQGFDASRYDLVVTGEGTVDATTVRGKLTVTCARTGTAVGQYRYALNGKPIAKLGSSCVPGLAETHIAKGAGQQDGRGTS